MSSAPRTPAASAMRPPAIFPTTDHLTAWAKPAPRTVQSGGKNITRPTGKSNPWLKGALVEAAMSAARSNTFLGAR